MKHLVLTLLLLFSAVGSLYAEPHRSAPAAATELEAYFESGSLSGILSFSVPKTTIGGDALSGMINYKVLVDGTQMTSGTGYPGVSASKNLTMPRVGEYTFTVVFYNEFGDGEPATIKAGVGYYQPQSPVVTATLTTGNNCHVSWNAITRDTSGANLNTDVTYNAVRMPDRVVVARGISATSFDDNIPNPETATPYYYMVESVAHYIPSEAAMSNVNVIGSIKPPFTEGFEEEENLLLYTITDGDNDGNTWKYYYSEIYCSDGKNDWLITPAVSVEPGKLYDVSIKMRARSISLPPNFEICWGTSPDPQSMTNTVIPPTLVNSERSTSYNGLMSVGNNDKIYIGLHNIDAGYGSLATALSISSAIAVETPAAVTDLTASSDVPEDLKATISFKAPTKDMNGGNISSLTKIEVLRGEELIKTFDNPTPGQQLSFTDTSMTEAAEYSYTVTAYNAGGAGPSTSVKIFVGPNLPARPKWARATETSTNGEVMIEWEVPTTYADGRPLDPSTLTFNIYTPIGGQDVKILADLKGNSHTFQAIFPDEPQYLFYYCITSQNAAGENLNPAVTEMIPLGEPYEAPYEDSFADLYTKYLYGEGTEEIHTYWDYASDSTYPDIKTYDNDNGMLALKANEIGYASYHFSCKIDLSKLTKPALTLYVHNNAEDKDNTLEISINDRTGFKTAGTWTVGSTGANGWNRITVPLDEYKNKSIQFKLTGRTVSSSRLLVDNIRIVDRYDHDLAIKNADIPVYIKAGNDCDVKIDYMNEGLNDASAFDIEYLVNGNVVESRHIASLKSDGNGSETFNLKRNANSASKETVSFAIRSNNDQKIGNNKVESEVETYFPEYPSVKDLRATYPSENDNNITLSWSAPDMNVEIFDNIIETFEDAEDWAENVEGWTFYDMDQGGVYGFGTWVEIPGIDVLSPHSWWVVNGDYAPLYNHFAPDMMTTAHSGSKYITSMAVLVNGLEERCDDWAVSPELTGKEQPVAFWARSFYETDPESFDFMISKTGKDVSDFELLQSVKNVPYDWTRYSFNIPDGSRYFAIRSRSRDCFMLMVDDVDFAPKTMGYDLEQAGYNIYRDGQKVNDAPVMDVQYVINDDSHSHKYNVTALYKNRGESSLSNTATPEYSSVAETMMANIKVSSSEGTICIDGAENMPVSVFSIDGKTVASVVSDGHTVVRVAAGIYMVTAGRNTYKVIVK